MADRSESKSYALSASVRSSIFFIPGSFPGLILTENTDSHKRALGGKKNTRLTGEKINTANLW